MDSFLTKLHVMGIGETSHKVNVVSVYEDYSTRARANEFCQGLARDLGQDCELHRQAWLVNLLRLPQLRSIAALDAAAGDVVIVSLHNAHNVPEDVRSWIDLWRHENGHRPKVLVALFDIAYREETPAMQAWLEAVAKQGNMEFFVQLWEITEGRQS
jgi:hypothetical protein